MNEKTMGDAWHGEPVEWVATALRSDLVRGLDAAEAARRLAADGPNEISKGTKISPLAILVAQFRSLVIWVLIGAAGVSIVMGEVVDGAAILAIVVLNALIGFFQEFRAEKAAAALARLAAPRARVVREGHAKVIPAAEVVRGDVLLLEAGDLIAADARVAEASVLRSNDAPLTGESQPVDKHAGTLSPDAALADRRNMVYLGTSIVNGSGRAVVVATGMATEVGHIATLLQTASSDETPLQRRLDEVASRLLWASLGIVLVVFALGLLRSIPPFEMFLGAVSLAVAAIPEGLPAVVTVALALGVQRMARRNALVKRLPAVETLGCAEVICSDKTGTLTVGEMTARRVVADARTYRVSGEGYGVAGDFLAEGSTPGDVERVPHPPPDPVLASLLRAAAACNEAELAEQAGRPSIVGDPTEGALLVAAAKGGVHRHALEAAMPRLAVLPFDSDRKRMTIVRERDGEPWAFVKGAPEVVVERCTHRLTEHGVEPLTDGDRTRVAQAAASMANEALRVLALAERRLDRALVPGAHEAIERDLILLGLVGLQDPPRAEAREAVAACKRAGIKPVMITGDHPDTALAVARELGIADKDGLAVAGRELDRLSDEALAARVKEISVYARVTAEHKLRIVRAWKSHGAVVAMTGDGVNDAPALKEASIGVAMGISGTEVTKEAADIIVTDDNFASIVAAVEEGRGIYDNIAKTLGYLLAGNSGELIVMLVAALIGWPMPLLPIHLLWINLVTDGLPALALATDPIDRDVLSRPPRRQDDQLLDKAFLMRVALTGCLTATVALTAFAYEYFIDGNVEDARNAAFSALVIAELLRAFGARSSVLTVWQVGLLSNLRLFAVVVVSFALQLAIHHVPALQRIFGTEPISLMQCLAWTGLGLVPVAVMELLKLSRQVRARPYDGDRVTAPLR